MANEFKIKKGLIVTGASGGTVVDIQGSQGQLFSVTDDLSGSIFAVSDISGVPILDINSSGLSTFDGDVNLPDSKKILLGTGDDLQLYHDGSHSYIRDTGVGNLIITGSQLTFSNVLDTEYMAKMVQDGTVELYYNGSKKFETTSTGVKVTGGATITGTNTFLIESNSTAATFNLNSTVRGFDFINNNATLLSIDNDGNGTFADQAFATTATSSGDGSSTLTTKGYVDGLITGATIYRGAWDPSGGGYGSPDLSGVTQTSGYYYICSAAGTAEPNGTGCEPDSWETGDWVIWNDDIVDCAGTGTGGWQKIDNSSVLSGVGTGQTVALWEGASSVTDSETLGNAPITVDSNNVNFADSISVADSARFEGTASPITIGDGFGYGGSATICKHNGPLYLQYNNGQAATDLNLGGNGTAVRINDSENNNYRFTSDSADSYVLSGGGDFGIGISNPNATLHVKNNAAGITARIQQGADGEESAIRFQTLDGTTPRYTDIAQSATTGNLDIRAPYNATTPNLTIKNGGNVGINIDDPQTQLHISGGTPSPNSTAITSTAIGLAISGNDGLMDLLSYDDNTTVATSIGMGRYNQTTGSLIDKWGLVTWYDTGNEGSNLSEKISLHYGTNKTPWSSTQMVTVLRDGNVGIGTNTPFANASDNNGLNIDRGGHSSLLIGDGVNDGGMIQSSDNAQRLIITANAYDSPTASWSRFTADGAALIDVYGEGSSAFISLNVDNGTAGFPAARLTVSNTGGIQFNTYGGTAKTGTPTYLLGTDASGNVVKTNTVPGSGAGPYLPLSAGSGERVTGDLYISDKLYMRPSATYGNGYKVMHVTGTGNAPYPTIINFSNYAKPSVMVINDENVGIGTTGPNSPLDIRRTSDGIALELISTVGDADEFVDLKMISGNTTAGTLGTILRHQRDGSGGGDFSILTNPTLTGTPTEKLIVKSNGNVGIGTSTPLAKLDIQGTQGQLFSVTDDLSGSIFAVSDISGVPIFDVNSSGVSYFDGKVEIGTATVAAANAAADDLWLRSTGSNGITISSGNAQTGTIFFGDVANAAVAGFRYNHNTGDMAISAEDNITFACDNVGIGTTSPGQKLDVVGGFIRSISTGANLVQGAFVAQSSTTDSPGYRGQGYFTYNEELDVSWYMGTPYTNGDMFSINRQNTTTSFDTGAANMNGTNVDNFFAIKNNGNVGIGTTNPGSKLEINENSTGTVYSKVFNQNAGVSATARMAVVAQSAQLDIIATSAGYTGVSGWADSGVISTDSGASGGLILNAQTGGLKLQTATSTKMVVLASGNVGIGPSTTSPVHKLEVRDGTISGEIAKFSAIGATVVIESSTAGNAKLFLKPNATGSKRGEFRVTDANDYGFLWTADTSSNGTAYMELEASSTGGGDLTVKGDVIAYGSPSDKKYKENIKPIESALDKAMKLQGVTFDWKDNDSILDIKEDIGFIAQDVQEVLPELVRENKKGNLSLRYQGITPILLEAIKELKAEIEELKKQIK